MSRRSVRNIKGASQKVGKAATIFDVAAFIAERKAFAKDSPSKQTPTRRSSWWAR